MSIKVLMPLSVTLLLAGCSGGAEISRTSFETSGKTWPLTVDSGTVTCTGGNAVFFEDAAGRRFAVNGIARNAEPGLPQLDEITAVDQAMLRMIRAAGDTNPFKPRLDNSVIFDIGLSLC